MAKYRKKPIIIEAIQWDGNNIFEIMALMHPEKPVHVRRFLTNDALGIKTLEGLMQADLNDWIIKGVKGEIYPCKPDIFEMTYELVEE